MLTISTHRFILSMAISFGAGCSLYEGGWRGMVRYGCAVGIGFCLAYIGNLCRERWKA